MNWCFPIDLRCGFTSKLHLVIIVVLLIYYNPSLPCSVLIHVCTHSIDKICTAAYTPFIHSSRDLSSWCKTCIFSRCYSAIHVIVSVRKSYLPGVSVPVANKFTLRGQYYIMFLEHEERRLNFHSGSCRYKTLSQSFKHFQNESDDINYYYYVIAANNHAILPRTVNILM